MILANKTSVDGWDFPVRYVSHFLSYTIAMYSGFHRFPNGHGHPKGGGSVSR